MCWVTFSSSIYKYLWSLLSDLYPWIALNSSIYLKFRCPTCSCLTMTPTSTMPEQEIYSTSKTLHYFWWVTFNSCIYLGLWNSSIYPGLCITSSLSMCPKFTVWLVSMNHFQLNNIFNIQNCIISVESLSISAYTLVCECASTMTLHQLIAAEWRIYASANLPASVEIMACRLVCAKPLSKPVLEYC